MKNIFIFIRIIFIILLSLLLIYSIYKSYKLNLEKFSIKKEISRDEFDCYVINLKKNTDRLGLINELYNKSDLSSIPYIRVEAINGKEIDIKPYVTDRVYNGIINIDTTGERHYHTQITRGAIGCYLSHLDVYNRIKANNKPYGLIIEDDAWFNEDIYKSGIKNILEKIPEDWDIILLGKIDLETINKETYLEMRKFWGTHGYLINQAGISKMLSLANIPINDQIDAVMGNLAREGKLHIYAPLEQYISSNTSFNSEVQMAVSEKNGLNPNDDPFLINK